MTFDEILDQALALLQRRGCLTYRALQERRRSLHARIVEALEALGMCPLAAHCHRGLGLLHCQIGHGEQARTALSAAIELYRAMDMTFWLPQAEATLAQVEGS